MGSNSSKRLNKEDIDFLKKNTRFDDQTIQEWYKGFISDCPNGQLTPDAFVKIYSKFFPSGNAEDFCQHIFNTFDMDKNGSIDFKEFLLAIDITAGGTPEDKLNWAFSMYDLDGNGTIDLPEMTKMVKSIYKMIGPEQKSALAGDANETPEIRAKAIFQTMDINSDGRITRSEFVQTCSNDRNLLKLLSPMSQ